MQQQEFQGVICDITYYDSDTGFLVLTLELEEEYLTVTGTTPVALNCGEEIIATGKIVNHPTYGRQLKADSFQMIMPETATAILRYLSGGAVKGIGPATAARLVEKFGEKTLDIIENSPERLSSIRGISAAKAKSIADEYKRIIGIRSVMSYLAIYGIDANAAIASWKKWGITTREKINENPFCLCSRDVGIAFDDADKIAISMGFGYDSPCRIEAGVLYVLNHNTNNGHSCVPKKKLLQTAAARLDIAEEYVEDGLLALKDRYEVVLDNYNEVEYVYLREQGVAEEQVAKRLQFMLRYPSVDAPVSLEEIKNAEAELEIEYAQLQKAAISAAVDNPIMILTGGPGTGKTTTLKGIITLLSRRGLKVALAAPTGRAAKRLSDVTGREAKTIHRLLEVEFGSREKGLMFKRREDNPLPYDAVVIDEMSMVDILLFHSLLKAVRTTTRLILVGDPDQLPSVGAGNVLKDLIQSEIVACIHLHEVFRQAANSLIVTSAHKIVSGEMPSLATKDSDLFFLPAYSQQQAAQTVVDLCTRRLPKAYGYCPVGDIQVIAPTKQGGAGTNQLNRMLQEAVNPPSVKKSECQFGALLLREGDKVMQVKNNYDIEWTRPDGEEGLGIFNGDIGIISLIDRPSRSVIINFDDRKAIYSFDSLNEIDLAYAITVHKSQGNEFDVVVIPLLGRHSKLHYRNLLYTAITRAKKLLVMVGQQETIFEMIANDRKTLRYTNLTQRLTQIEDE